MDMLTEYFEILKRFAIIRSRLPRKSYEAYMELEVSIREMTECDTPSSEQWKAMERFGKTKYILHPLEQVSCIEELTGQRRGADGTKT